MSTHYEIGRRFEYKVAKQMRDAGYVVMRTAGSHGFYDLIAIRNASPHVVVMVQCKTTQTYRQAKRLLNQFVAHPPFQSFLCDFEQRLVVWTKDTRKQYQDIV